MAPASKRNLRDVHQLLMLNQNTCVDCSSPCPTHADLSFSVLICADCARLHKNFACNPRILSLRESNWTVKEVKRFDAQASSPQKGSFLGKQRIGQNQKLQQFFLAANFPAQLSTAEKYGSNVGRAYRATVKAAEAGRCGEDSPPIYQPKKSIWTIAKQSIGWAHKATQNSADNKSTAQAVGKRVKKRLQSCSPETSPREHKRDTTAISLRRNSSWGEETSLLGDNYDRDEQHLLHVSEDVNKLDEHQMVCLKAVAEIIGNSTTVVVVPKKKGGIDQLDQAALECLSALADILYNEQRATATAA